MTKGDTICIVSMIVISDIHYYWLLIDYLTMRLHNINNMYALCAQHIAIIIDSDEKMLRNLIRRMMVPFSMNSQPSIMIKNEKFEHLTATMVPTTFHKSNSQLILLWYHNIPSLCSGLLRLWVALLTNNNKLIQHNKRTYKII
jgi:hypothetical protein